MFFIQIGVTVISIWWGHSFPTNVARVWFPDAALYVGWVCSWFSSLLRGFFSGFSSFPPFTKIDTSKFQFDLETVDEEPLCVIIIIVIIIIIIIIIIQ